VHDGPQRDEHGEEASANEKPTPNRRDTRRIEPVLSEEITLVRD